MDLTLSKADLARKSKIVHEYGEAILLIQLIEGLNCKMAVLFSCKNKGLKLRLQDGRGMPIE